MSLASELASDYVDSIPHRPILTSDKLLKDAASLRTQLWQSLTDKGVPTDQVLQELSQASESGLNTTTSGRYFGFVIGSTLPIAIAADWLTSAYDQNAGSTFCSPASAVVEEVCGAWLKDLLGLPPSCSFTLTSGCQMAHVTALLVARNHLLERAGWNVKEDGLWGAPKIRILAGQYHETIKRALWFLGMGSKVLQDVAVLEDGTIDLDDLQQKLEQIPAETPTIVCLAAGELNRGTFDPIGAVSDMVHEQCPNSWVHVDGAFGLWAAASPTHRHLTEGMIKADSWATDGHKILQLPQDHGFCFIKDELAHRQAFSIYAAYAPDYANQQRESTLETTPTEGLLPLEGPVREPYHYGLEWSRRAKGFVIYATLRHLGRQGVADLFQRLCQHATYFVDALSELSGVQVLARPIINQGLVRFLEPSGQECHDEYTDEIIARINFLSNRMVWWNHVEGNARHANIRVQPSIY